MTNGRTATNWANNPIIIVISVLGSIGIVTWILDTFVIVPDMNITATIEGNSTSRLVKFSVTNNWISTAEDVRVTYLTNGKITEPIGRRTPEQLTTYVTEDKSTFVGTLPRIVSFSKVEFAIKIENGASGYVDEIWATNKKSQAYLKLDPEEGFSTTMFPKYYALLILIGAIIVVANIPVARYYRRTRNPQDQSSADQPPKTEKVECDNMLFDYILSGVRTRESSTLVIATVASSASLVLLALNLDNSNTLFTLYAAAGFWFPIIGFVYREITINSIDHADHDDLNGILGKQRKTMRRNLWGVHIFSFTRGMTLRLLLLIPSMAWASLTATNTFFEFNLNWLYLIITVVGASAFELLFRRITFPQPNQGQVT